MPTFRAGFALPLDELRDDLDRLWGSLVAAPPAQRGAAATAGRPFPLIDVSETEACITVVAELPGLDSSAVDISVMGDELVLKGTRAGTPPALPNGTAAGPEQALPAADAGTQSQPIWHRRERSSGAFERRLTLPAVVDSQRVEARLTHGLLTITCPKALANRPHRVPVMAS